LNKYLPIVQKIIRKFIPAKQYQVFVFGSWAKQQNDQFSDLDIGVLGNERLHAVVKINLESALQESIVPFKVDIVDFFTVSASFKQEALQHSIPLFALVHS
jgi:predicted nucleotidyltransferase